MEWVETTGKTVAEAVEKALAQLGVAQQDAEVEVLSEPRPGLFGRLRVEARVRARVRPTAPRSRNDRNERRRRTRDSRARSTENSGTVQDEASLSAGNASRPRRKKADPKAEAHSEESLVQEQSEEVVSLEVQGELANQFLTGLLECFEVDAAVELNRLDEDSLEVGIKGAELGFLIGPRGATLAAIEDLVRTVVRRSGAPQGRIFLDVAGYREQRRNALQAFAKERAAEVLQSGTEQVLEPMVASDRRVVHDSVGEIPGVGTRSEGEEPHRRVILFKEA